MTDKELDLECKVKFTKMQTYLETIEDPVSQINYSDHYYELLRFYRGQGYNTQHQENKLTEFYDKQTATWEAKYKK